MASSLLQPSWDTTLLMIFICAVSASGLTETQILFNFKASLNNKDTALRSWDAAGVPCTGEKPLWTGVICTKEGSVWGLQLENMNLSGVIDIDALELLRDMRTLSFMNNSFEGPIPNIKKLDALKNLYLSNNLFTGDIPDDAFGDMVWLKKVYLAQNGFTGLIPSSLTKLPRLLELRLDGNQFRGKVPDFPQKDLYNELPSLSVAHGHLKSSNVLLNQSFEPLLSDYCLIPVINKDHAVQYMIAYKSPEYTEYGRLSKRTDCWSLGILILEMITGKYPEGKGGSNADLAKWVNSVVREEWTGEVFDKELRGTKKAEGQMLKLLKIALGCCEQDVDQRWDLKEAVEKIQELTERDTDDEDYSSYASEMEVYSSTAMTDEDFSFSTNA